MRSTDSGDAEDAHDRVMRLTQLLVAEADKVSNAFVARHRMHATDMNTLRYLFVAQHQGQPVTAGFLGDELGLTSGAVTAVVDRLERSGNLQRVRDQHDRRRVWLETTTAGQRLAEQYFAPVRARSEEVLDQFTTDELDTISRYLDATAQAMAAHRNFLTTQENASDH